MCPKFRRGSELFQACQSRICKALGIALAVFAALTAAAGDSESKVYRSWTFVGEGVSVGFSDTVTLAPRGDLYPQYIADPHRPVFSIQSVSVNQSEIPDAGSPRYGLKLGGRFGVFRKEQAGDPNKGFQLSFEAGFKGQFDSSQATDNIGWDGHYGVNLSYRPWRKTAMRFGIQHTSSHLGDEYIERTGRTRIEYTREEIYGGISHEIGRSWLVYGEAGYATDLRNDDLQKPMRLQSGAQYQSRLMFGGRLGWYSAINTTAFEERDWQPTLTVQAGVFMPHLERVRRIGIEYHDGRSSIGEFFRSDEQHLAVGIWLEL
jgi:hypothetical protein